MKLILIGVITIFLVSLVAGGFITIRDPRDDECPKTGPRCSSNCKEIILCTATSEAPLHVATCPEDKFCNSKTAGEPNCDALFCNEEPFRCTLPGGVPDPANPASYYLCPGANSVGFPASCENGTYFDTQTLACSRNDPEYAPIQCTALAQLGQIGQDGRFCYICDDLYQPLVFLCSLKSSEEPMLPLMTKTIVDQMN